MGAAQIHEMIREEFRSLNEKLDLLNQRVLSLEKGHHREEGFKEGAGSVYDEVKDLRLLIEAAGFDIKTMNTRVNTIGKGVPWILGVIGGVIGIIAVVVELIRWLT